MKLRSLGILASVLCKGSNIGLKEGGRLRHNIEVLNESQCPVVAGVQQGEVEVLGYSCIGAL